MQPAVGLSGRPTRTQPSQRCHTSRTRESASLRSRHSSVARARPSTFLSAIRFPRDRQSLIAPLAIADPSPHLTAPGTQAGRFEEMARHDVPKLTGTLRRRANRLRRPRRAPSVALSSTKPLVITRLSVTRPSDSRTSFFFWPRPSPARWPFFSIRNRAGRLSAPRDSPPLLTLHPRNAQRRSV